jgi:hypothetical protein
VEEGLKSFWLCFVPLFVAVDAIGVLPMFMSLTEGLDTRSRRRVVYQSVITAAVVGLSFLALGNSLLGLLGITVAVFIVANFLDLRGIKWIYSNVSHVALIGLIVIFQPELRKVFERAASLRRKEIGKEVVFHFRGHSQSGSGFCILGHFHYLAGRNGRKSVHRSDRIRCQPQASHSCRGQTNWGQTAFDRLKVRS